ncbi:hypothetical protein GCM10010400_45340 [Streptomyces aculeolatus]
MDRRPSVEPETRDAAPKKWRVGNDGWLTAAQSARPCPYLAVEYEAVCRVEHTEDLEDFVGLPLRGVLSAMRPRTPAPEPAVKLPARSAAVLERAARGGEEAR